MDEGQGEAHIIAGVVVNPYTGEPAIIASPEVDPVSVFMRAIINHILTEMKAAAEKPQVLQARGEIPRSMRND